MKHLLLFIIFCSLPLFATPSQFMITCRVAYTLTNSTQPLEAFPENLSCSVLINGTTPYSCTVYAFGSAPGYSCFIGFAKRPVTVQPLPTMLASGNGSLCNYVAGSPSINYNCTANNSTKCSGTTVANLFACMSNPH